MMKDRLFVLDVFRGLAIVIMIIVDASPGETYSILMHSLWEGITIADLAFPFFVFAMGMSAALSKKFVSTKIINRVVMLILIGLTFNIFPDILNYLITSEEINLTNFRLLGILQRLALTFIIGLYICKTLKFNVKIILVAFVLMFLSSLGSHIYSPDAPFDKIQNINRALDILVLGENHIYQFYGFPFDPENLYGTINSVASMLFGFVACQIIISKKFFQKKIQILFLFSITFITIGEILSCFDIISKPLWTAPYVLITSGISFLLLTIFLWLFEHFPAAKIIFQPLSAFGINSLFFFIATNFLLIILSTFCIEEIPIYIWIWQHTIRESLNVQFGATLYMFFWCLLWLPLAEIFFYKKIFIKL